MLLLVLFMASLRLCLFQQCPPFNQQLLLLPSKQFSSLSLSSPPPSSSSIYDMIQLVSHQIKGHVCNQSVDNVFFLLSFFSFHFSPIWCHIYGYLMTLLSCFVTETSCVPELLNQSTETCQNEMLTSNEPFIWN